MKISQATRYSVRALIHLAKRDGRIVTAHQIAEEEKLSRGFLARLMVVLAKNGIAISLKGPHGGFRLAKPAKEITLLEIMEAVDGPIVGEVSLNKINTPPTRKLQGLCTDIAKDTRNRLAKVKLSDLAK